MDACGEKNCEETQKLHRNGLEKSSEALNQGKDMDLRERRV